MRRYLSHFGDETDNFVGHLTAAVEIWEKYYDIKSANQTNEHTKALANFAAKGMGGVLGVRHQREADTTA
jgi:hypothetical protein